MAHTFNNIWSRVINFENLYHAYRTAKKGKRYRFESLDFKKYLEENLIILQNELIWNEYHPQEFRQFYVFEPKKRLISAPTFRDRVVHHALVDTIQPIFENKFIKDSYACMVGRGTHAAMKHVLFCARRAKRNWGSYYVLKCDIHKFFPSINHDVLKKIIRRTIRDKKVLGLIDNIIDSYSENGRGIPIGSLTSQLFANVGLDPLDHLLKDKKGIKNYARYMDDFVIIHKDKEYLQKLLVEIKDFVQDELDLTLNPKTGIFPEKHGIDFCGYRIWPTHVKYRKSTMKRAKRRLRKMVRIYQDDPGILQHAHDSIVSFLGYIKHCSGYRATKEMLEKYVFKAGSDRVSKPVKYKNHFKHKQVLKKE